MDDKKDFGRPGIVQPPSSSSEGGTKLNKLPKHVRAEWGEKGLSKVDPDVRFHFSLSLCFSRAEFYSESDKGLIR